MPGEGPFTPELLGKTVTLGGRLHDTSAIDLFYVDTYDGLRINRQRLYVKERVYVNPLQFVWCSVTAKISEVDVEHQDHNQIEILSHQPIEMKPVFEGLSRTMKWVEANRRGIDMNRLKADPDFANTFGKMPVGRLDINQMPYRPEGAVSAVDSMRGFAAFSCGQYILEQHMPHHIYSADISAIYDLNRERIVRVIISRGVYVEE